MALNVEGIVDGCMCGEKSLCRSWRFEPLHSSFALPDWQVGILSTVVTSTASDVFGVHAEISQRSPVGWEFISHHLVGCIALLLQQFAHQFECGIFVLARLNQNIEHLALAIYGSPQIHPFAVDRGKHFVQVPAPIRSGTQSSQLPRVAQSKFQHSTPDCFIRNIDPAFSKQIFHFAKAERKSKIQPDRIFDNFRREAMTTI